MLNLGTVLLTFVVIFPAELPDKSMLASLVLGTRFRTLPVWLGVTSAFIVHVVIAVVAGGLLSLLPSRLVEAVVAVLFAIGAAILLLGKDEYDDPEDDAAAAAPGADVSNVRTFWTAFGVVFVGEWGDITQLATANLAAKYSDPLSVGLGAALALSSVAGLVLLAGDRLLRRVPLDLVRRIAGFVLLILAVVSLVQLVR